MRLPTIVGEFRVGSDPELRFTPSGKAVCTISLIATESRKTDTGWEDGDSTPWITASIWEAAGEEAAETIKRGAKVLVTGLLYVRKYEKNDGSEGQSIELKWATVAPIPGGESKGTRTREPDYANDPWVTPPSTPGGRSTPNVPAGDPWATPGVSSDEPPF